MSVIEKAIKEAHDHVVRHGAAKIVTVVHWTDKVTTTIETTVLGEHSIRKDMAVDQDG